MESIIEETNDVQCIDAVTKIAINSASSLSQRNVSGLMTSQNPELPEIKSLQKNRAYLGLISQLFFRNEQNEVRIWQQKCRWLLIKETFMR